MKSTRIMAFAALIALIAVLTGGCGGAIATGSMSGYVVVFAGAKGVSQQSAGVMGVIPTPQPDTKPLEGAYVEAEGPSGLLHTRTNSDGWFGFARLLPGYYRVSISASGSLDRVDTFCTVSAGINTPVGNYRLGSIRVLSIGINDYRWANPLQGPVNDAVLLKDVLGDDSTLAAEWRLLNDSLATKEGIRSAIEGLGSEMGPGDTFIMSFSGHGMEDGVSEYIIPYDFSGSVNTAIRDQELKQWVDQYVRAGKSVFIFDSCYSGGMASSANVLPAGVRLSTGFDIMARNILAPGRIVMTASSKYQESYELSGLGPYGNAWHGAFAWCLAKGMLYPSYPADANSDFNITTQEAFNYAKSSLGPLLRSYSIDPDSQTPQLFSDPLGSWFYMFSY